MFHPMVRYMLIPVYVICGWAWFLRVGTWGFPEDISIS